MSKRKILVNMVSLTIGAVIGVVIVTAVIDKSESVAGILEGSVLKKDTQSSQENSEDLPYLKKAARSEDEQRMINAYQKANEAVAFITTVRITVDPFDLSLLTGRQTREGTGSGVLIDPERGIIVTNLHVIGSGPKQIEVSLADGKSHIAKLLGYDEDTDLAVLQISHRGSKLVGVNFADSSVLEVGQRVLAIGNPFGLDRTLTTGIISSLNRAVRTPSGALMKGLIQTDAAINPGNSGGPLLDLDGDLIGITTAILSRSGDSAGIGFSIPANQIRRILPELIQNGRVRRPTLGWLLWDTTHGPMVRRVFQGGPADLAGLTPVERIEETPFLRGMVVDFDSADLIVEVNGAEVGSAEEVEELVRNAGTDQITLTLKKGGLNGAARRVTLKPILR